MIEIMVVIGVLIVLSTIVLLGMRHITTRTRQQQTQVSMQNLRNMLAEYNARTRMKAPTEWLWWNAPGAGSMRKTLAAGSTLDFWRVPERTTGSPPEPAPMATIGSVVVTTEGANDRTRKAVVNTAIAMTLLTQLPENRNALQSFQDKLMQLPNDPDITTPGYDESLTRIPLDAWGNPIILVPGSGLWGLEVGGVTIPNDPDRAIKAPDNQPFWASAGPDGDFSKGDDNIYSFEE